MLALDEEAGGAGHGLRKLRGWSWHQSVRCGKEAARRKHWRAERELLDMDLKQYMQYLNITKGESK